MCWHFCGSVFVFHFLLILRHHHHKSELSVPFSSLFSVSAWYRLWPEFDEHSLTETLTFLSSEKKKITAIQHLEVTWVWSRCWFAHTSPKIPLNTRINEMKNNETAEIQRTWIIPASTRQQRTWVCNDMYHTGALKCQVSFGSKDPYFDQALVGTAGCGTICDFYLKTPSYLL